MLEPCPETMHGNVLRTETHTAVQALAVVRHLLESRSNDDSVVQALSDFLQTPAAEHEEILSLDKCTGAPLPTFKSCSPWPEDSILGLGSTWSPDRSPAALDATKVMLRVPDLGKQFPGQKPETSPQAASAVAMRGTERTRSRPTLPGTPAPIASPMRMGAAGRGSMASVAVPSTGSRSSA